MFASAETLLDEAQAVLVSAEKNMPSVHLAKEIASIYRLRAGIRNSAYRGDKAPLVQIDTPRPKPKEITFNLVIAKPRPHQTYEHDK